VIETAGIFGGASAQDEKNKGEDQQSQADFLAIHAGDEELKSGFHGLPPKKLEFDVFILAGGRLQNRLQNRLDGA
jgi:hypothetical protein